MEIELLPYLEQRQKWPETGRHILAQYDSDSIIVYQAYCKEIGEYALSNRRFGGRFGFSRMSWIKPNFLWMMYRSGWGAKRDQEVILAIRISRDLFDELLEKAVPSTFIADPYESHNDWKQAVDRSEVRVQWDPDHSPTGEKLERKAIQLGLRGSMLERYAMHPIEIIDMRSLVAEQRQNAIPERYSNLRTPREDVYIPSEP
jgi:hypothetical protein